MLKELITGLALVVALGAEDIPLGALGGTGDPVTGTGLIRVTGLDPGGPASLAGIEVGDLLAGVEGRPFGVTSANTNDGYVGAVQDLGNAIDRAEGGAGTLGMSLLRSGVGGVEVVVNVGSTGSLGPAWPASSPKGDAIYEWCCAEIHSQVQASSSANFGYCSGWYGIVLLSHPAWNQTGGATPFRNSIDKLRTRCEDYLNGRAYEPVEPSVDQGLYDSQSPGLENWDICSSATFLALYRQKTGDASADAIVQAAAGMIANRIQHWSQYNDAGTVLVAGNGRMGHGGVHGDYSHYNGAGGLNIINAHAVVALGTLRQAGANVGLVPGTVLNDASGDPLPTIDEKFRLCWDWLKQATNDSGGPDDGNVGYVGKQGGGDSSGRTGGAIAGWELYGMAATADDLDHLQRQKAYLARRWFRQQHCHAYTLGGVALTQMAMPFLDDRSERFHQENSRFLAALARQPDGSVAYVPGRQNNGGDGYLNRSRVALVNAAIFPAVRSGNLPGFAAPAASRLLVDLRHPAADWPLIEARRVELSGGLSHLLELDVTDVDGAVLSPASYSASWTHVSGPGTAVFGSPAAATSSVDFPQDGTYRVEFEAVKDGYTLTEPIDLVVSSAATPAGVAPYLVSQPVSQSAEQGGLVTFAVDAQGSAPLVYEWRLDGVPVAAPSTSPELVIDNLSAASAGDYDCVITNAHGTVTSSVATLTVNGTGSFAWGGLWQEVFTGLAGSGVGDLTGAAKFPSFPDASGVIPGPESTAGYADNYGQRWSGWVTPPESGSYRFYIASDDSSELWLSTDATRANRVRIAWKNGYTGARQWSGGGSSGPIPLVAGQRYFLEVLHKEGGGGDHCAVTWDWQSPGVWSTPANGSEPLPGAVLEYQVGGTLDDGAEPPADYPPVADPLGIVVFGGVATPITLSGRDFEEASLAYLVTELPSKGALGGSAPNLTYTPNPGASGTDRFRFEVSDGSQSSVPAEVTITLIPESGADLQVWEGTTDALWTSAGNWLSGTTTTASDAALFSTDSIANLATSLGAGASIKRLVVTDPIGAVSIADHTLTLDGGIEMLAAEQDLTIDSDLSLPSPQPWSVAKGRVLTLTGSISGSVAVTKGGEGLAVLEGVSPFGGELRVEEGTLELRGGGWYQGYVGGNSLVTIGEGASVVNANSHAFGSSNNAARSLVIDGGSFRLAAETYFRNADLTAGRVDNTPGGGGDFRARSGGSVLTVHAADEASVLAAAVSMVGPMTVVVADGPAGSDLLVSGALTNSGALTKDGDGRMTVSADCSHSGPLDLMLGRLAVTGSLAASSEVTVRGGSVLEGTGTVAGTVDQRGSLEPGLDGRAVLTIGTLVQDPACDTEIELAGTVAGSGHDRLVVTGAATLSGVLNVVLADAFVPQAGDRFEVLACGVRSGQFDTISLPLLPADRAWVSEYDPGGVPGLALSVVPVPPFEQWQQAEFGAEAGDPGVAGPLADPDFDGILNLMEYALRLNPKVPDATGGVAGGLPGVEAAAGGVSLVYRKNLAATDLVFTVEESSDAGVSDPWEAAGVSETVLADDGQVQRIRATMATQAPRAFLRLKVER